jgi:hypothetical protein
LEKCAKFLLATAKHLLKFLLKFNYGLCGLWRKVKIMMYLNVVVAGGADPPAAHPSVQPLLWRLEPEGVTCWP